MSFARIYQPSKTAMQSGRARTNQWILEFEPQARKVADPLMGWFGSGDVRRQIRLRFSSLDEAIAYADRHNITYTVQKPHARRIQPKSYADNFRV
ncbi:MAG: ETC complex I subunit [Hyphomicrobiales bacterium]|nr:ETC complex I subunit [Hyphomicrobiales bacterium]